MSDQPLTDAERAAMRARCEAATPGPWLWECSGREDVGSIEPDVCRFGDSTQYYPSEGDPPHEGDLAFILAARTDLPRALDEIERLTKAVAEERMAADAEAEGNRWQRNKLCERIKALEAERATAHEGDGKAAAEEGAPC